MLGARRSQPVGASSEVARREVVRVTGEQQLTAAVRDAEHLDPDWTWERVHAARRAPPPAAENAANVIDRVRALMHTDWGKEFQKREWSEPLDVPSNVRYSPKVIAQAPSPIWHPRWRRA